MPRSRSTSETGDARIIYILDIVEPLFHCSSEEERGIIEANEVTDFLDDPSCRTLCIRRRDDQSIILDRSVIFEDDDTLALVFHKISPEPITEATMRQKICFVNLLESPVSSFHHNLANVFKPTINDSQFWSRRIEPKLHTCMTELSEGLTTTINKSFGAFNKVKDVFTVDDELDIWTSHEQNCTNKAERKAVKAVRDVILDISRELHQCVDVNSGMDFLDGIQMSLQQLWGLGEISYPQSRLIHLLDLIGTQVTQIVQNAIKHIKIWTDSFSLVDSQLSWGIDICTKVNDLSLKCTRITWPRYDPAARAYTLEEYVPASTGRYVKRLEELLRVRSVHREITYLVPISECHSLHPKKAFIPFNGINLIFSNSHTDKAFDEAVKAFDLGLVPAEAKLSLKLRDKLGAKLSNAQLMLEFKRYCQLIERPKVSHDVQSQREQMLLIYKEAMKENFKEIDSGEYMRTGGENSAEVNSIFNIRQIYFKGKELEDIAKKTMEDLFDYPGLDGQFIEFTNLVNTLQDQLFNEWKKHVNVGLLNEGLALKDGTPVIDFNESNSFMEVNYSKKLHALISDSAQLMMMGFRMTEDVNSIIFKAGLFVKQANELDQIASFHNTIGDRMVRSQRPMMLDTALALSELISSQHSISWNSITQIEEYVNNFRSIVRRLSRQNNYLCQIHMDIVTKVSILFNLDLYTEMHKWRVAQQDILKIIADVEAEGYRSIKSWKNHWNHQIYKGFEIAYIKSLKDINLNLPVIPCEIIYRRNRLVLKPSIEELSTIYANMIRQCVYRPLEFTGITGEEGESVFFGQMIYWNKDLFEDIYEKAFLLLQDIYKAPRKYDKWVSIGSPNLKQTCEQNLQIAQDWDYNFKSCRNNVIQSGRVQFAEEFMPPFRISCKTLRMDVDSMNRKYFETLGDTVLNSTNKEVNGLEGFLKSAVRSLDSMPTSTDDILHALDIHQIINLADEHVTISYESILAKNKVIQNWVKAQVDTMSIQKLLMNYQSLARSFDAVISKQLETVGGKLDSEFEALEKMVQKFKSQWDLLQGKGGKGKAEIVQIMTFINEQQNDWVKITALNDRITQISRKLNLPVRTLSDVGELEQEINQFEEIWQQIDSFNLGLKKFESESWLTFRSAHFRFEEFLQQWIDEFKHVEENGIIANILLEIRSYQKLLPNIKYIRGDSFAEKHWTELYKILKMTPRPFSTLTLGDFLAVRHEIEANFKELKTLNRNAAGEVTVRQALDELDTWEIEASFSFVENLDSQKKPVQIIHDFKSVFNKVGDNQSLLQSIKSSPFYNRFADRINSWEVKMTDLDLFLTSLSKIQRRWIYLEPVFSHGVLDNEQTRFKRIDKDFRGILDSLVQKNRVSTLLRINGIRGILSNMLDQLGRCQNSLNEFLERKRSGFPRFYFLGDDDLLEILGQSTKPSVIQSHLKKLFGGIYNVDFDDGFENIRAMKSQEGEVVELKRPVKIRPNVEEWLSELAQEMKMTLKALTLECVSQKRNKKRDPDMFPSQILALCNCISFTGRCEENIRNGKLDAFLAELKVELSSYTNVQIDKDHPNPKVIELKLKDLILDLIHQISTVEFLMSTQLVSVTDFAWQKQLRFYVTEEGDVSVRMADAEFLYSYEYQGNTPKLVHTPLTNKCYLTLTQGMRIGLGGNPFGPAGTGKTESVKALGALLGRQVLVFNCDEGIDVKAMGRIFIGLVKCGAWGCFDEFNRLDAATLSAVSMQIQPIQSALKYGEKSVRLMDETVPLDPNTGIFVTLNPAGKGYGGRNELPDNLKQLFRPVAMTSPNFDLISEVILYTEGFQMAKVLGNKLVEIFNLASGLLTPQKHYDWGLRALKTVLKGCGNTLRNFKDLGLKAEAQDEVDIVVSALRLNTLPKLPYLDAVRFNSLIKDLFGDVVFKDLGHDELEKNVRASFEELKLHLNENQVRKCLQLYEQLEQRMGVVIVGPPLSGKSTICSILKHALIRMKTTVKTSTINPKAMLKSQLLGHINVDTRQWSDGVLTLRAQEVYNEREDVRSWIICDGDIDPEWVESLNSVLDDNRMLTLPSGWRIKFGPNVNFLFETHDLSYASPATVSRMGMILTSEEDADVNGVISSWLETQPISSRTKTEQLIKTYFHRGIDWISKAENSANLPLVSLVKNGLSHLSGVTTVPQMAIAMLRGIGCHLTHDLKIQFTKNILEWTDLRVDGNLSNITYSEEDQRLVCFDDIDFHDPSQGVKVTSPPLVKTANVKQTLAHIEPWMKNSDSFLLVGSEGCGKTMILEYAFGEMRDVEIATIHCSSLITPHHVLQKMSQVCISKSSGSGREYIAKNGGRLILYFKDLNLVKPDKWGTCQLVEFLHQVITHQGFYDTNLEWIWLRNVQIVASITLGSSDGRYMLSPRFTSNVRYCTVMEPLKEQLIVIYKTYVTLCLKSLHPKSVIGQSEAEIDKIVLAMIAVYEEVGKTFTRSTQNHYQFTSRDLTNWVFGMMRYDLDTSEDTNPMEDVIQIWAHETSRLFRDRLVSAKDRAAFDEIITNVLHQVWKYSNSVWKEKGFYFISGYSNVAASSSQTVITQSHTVGGQKSGKLFKASAETVANVVEKGMTQFARDYRSLNIVTFMEVLDNVAHFDRILSAPCSSMVLTGRAGIGRRTALSIVASLHGALLYSLKVGHHYGVKHFKNDLKGAIRLSAIEGTKVFLVVEDYQLIDDVFLDMLNGLLSSGEVPSLYTPEELEVVMSGLREVADEEGYSSSLLSFFVKRIKELLHVILIMDHTNNSFQNNCQRNPALYKNCTLLWLDSWSEESLCLIPKLIISKFYVEKADKDISDVGREDHLSDELMETFRSIYSSLTTQMASPRRYIAFIHTYGMLYTTKRGRIQEKISELKAGVQKLDEARAIVQNLRSDASAQEVVLAAKKEQTNKNWDAIMLGMQTTHAQEAHVKELQAKTVAENEIMLVKKQSIDNELAQIEPTLVEAQMSVGNLTNDSLIEIRSLRAPPETIKDILVGVLSLMGIQDTSWTSMKSFLGRRGVKDELRNFDSKKIKPADRKSVETILKNRASSFEPENAKRASRAAAPLAAWVIANVNYSQVLERIEPLMTQQAKLETNLTTAKAQIEELTIEKQRVSEENERLKADLEVTNKEVAELEVTLANVKKTLLSAEALVEKLQDEFVRWTAEASGLRTELESLPIRCILASAFVTYLCDANETERVDYVNKWLNLVKKQDSFDFCTFMSTEQEVLSFQNLGLPSDRLSQENAIIIMQTSLRPYLIDPSSRATEWLKAYLQANGHSSVNISLRDQKFGHELELAVRFGKALIIHEMDEIDPILMPILRGDFVSQGSRDTIQIGDKFVDYNSDFKLFMTTRNPSPVLSPDSAAVVTIVNFTTTRAGLTTQLLSTTLSVEKPELETRKSELLKQTDEMKQDLSKLGTQLLKELASATGNILENQELLNSLQQTKTKSNEINVSLAQKKAVEDSLNKEINVFLPLAEFGSILFFAILDVPKLNRLYKFSLSSFMQLFKKTLAMRYEGNQSTEKRIRYLQSSLEQLVYEYVCQSLFKGDRLAFAIHLSHAMHPEAFQENEWDMFVGTLSGSSNRGADTPSWIPEDRHSSLAILYEKFNSVYRNLHLDNELDWAPFMSNTDCENSIPTKVTQLLSPFQILLTIQALRPDRLFTAMSIFAKTVLNRKSLFPPPTSFREILDDTMAKEPILILIASGADPSLELRELGAAAVGARNYAEISMGKEEPEVVLERIQEAATTGKWICLKNLHLVTYWLDSLEKEIQKFKPHRDFRLWLTSEPHDNFPIILAETCLKVAYESPEGVKKNLQRTYTNWSKEYITEDRNLLRMQALFVLAFFHAIVQERRTYIPQGWSKFYEFNESDLRAGAEILDNIFKSSRGKKIQWTYIRGIYENAIYGGRVDNEFDLRILVSYLDNFFNDDILSGTTPPRQSLPSGIQLPLRDNYQDFVKILENFPDYDRPAMFGLPVNIERSWQRTMSTLVIQQLNSMARQFLEEGQFHTTLWTNAMNPILSIWRKTNQVNSTTNLLSQKVSSPGVLMKDKELDPLENFALLEQLNILDFHQTVHKTLAVISKIGRGHATATLEMLEVFKALSKREAPALFSRIWEGPPEIKNYLTGVVMKVVSIQSWVTSAQQDKLLSLSLNLADLLHPVSFLSAFKQHCARKQNVCMDELGFVCFWKRTGLKNGIPSCRLTGLYLEGCSFDGSKVIENTPESAHVSKVPECTIAWVPLTTLEDYKKGPTLSVPLYYNELRQKLITCLDFPVEGRKSKWIQAGVALFLKPT